MMDYSDERLKKIQDKSLNLMVELDDFFQKNNIGYMISAGTALGAVRHKGYIPWDDDVDFDMHIEDMHRLARVCKNNREFDEKFFLQNKWTDPNVPEIFWRIRLNGTTMMDKEGMYIKMHWGLPVDIFPVYNAPKKYFNRKLMLFISRRMNRHSKFHFLNPSASKLKKSFELFLFKVDSFVMDVISYLSKKSGYLYYPTGHGAPRKRFIKKEVYFPVERIMFEGHQLACHHDIEEYLRITYGDYMSLPPLEQRKNHLCYIEDLDRDYLHYVNY